MLLQLEACLQYRPRRNPRLRQSKHGSTFPRLRGRGFDELRDSGLYGDAYLTGIEVNKKDITNSNNSLPNLARVLGEQSGRPFNIGIFNAFPEYATSDLKAEYFNVDSVCCSELSRYFFPGDPENSSPPDTVDERENIADVLGELAFTLITTDNFVDITHRLQAAGQRNIAPLQGDYGSVPPIQPPSGGTTPPADSGSNLIVTNPPGSNFDLSIWELQLPTGSPGSPTTISNFALEGGYQDKYFYTSKVDGSLQMNDPGTGCVTTPHSAHCRTELRETNSSGSPASWSPSGTNKLDATVVVEDAGQSVVVGQVHLSDSVSTKPVVELYYDSNGSIDAGVETGPTADATQVRTHIGNIPLGWPFSDEINYTANVLSISLNGGAPVTLNTLGVGGLPSYFKVGNYGQNPILSVVGFYSIKVIWSARLDLYQ